MSSGHRLRLGLHGYLIRFAPLAFIPHRQIRSSAAPSPQVVLLGLKYCTDRLLVLIKKSSQSLLPLPQEYPAPLPVSSPIVFPTGPTVNCRISLGTLRTGYECFKPNKRGDHLGRGYYRGGWHPSYPPLIHQDF